MIRKLAVVALATGIAITMPMLLTAAVEPGPVATGTIRTATQPETTYPAAYPEPDWALMEQCWTGRDNSPGVPPAGCSGQYPLTLPCHWTVGYPSRAWVEEACGPISGWGPDFGFGWYGNADPHPGRDWVARMRAGSQP